MDGEPRAVRIRESDFAGGEVEWRRAPEIAYFGGDARSRELASQLGGEPALAGVAPNENKSHDERESGYSENTGDTDYDQAKATSHDSECLS